MNIKNNISWVGKIDWELRTFHGHEYSTHKGSTYNSYLIKEEKNVLIDTVWKPYAEEFVANLAKEIPLDKIDYVIANHGEVDHSGALAELIKYSPNVPVYCTANAVKSLKGQFHGDWNFQVVKTGDKLPIGNGKELIFIEAPMLHWPDTMMTYLTGDNILFSNDAFGQHYATEYMFNELVNQDELFIEAIKYYANILTPFHVLVDKKIKEFVLLNLPLDIICPSHGVIWRQNPMQIVQKYLTWANHYQENQITLVYDTMWQGTRHMAEAIAEGIKAKDKIVNIKLFNLSASDKNDVITEIFKSKGLLLGCPTLNRGVTTAMAGLLEDLKGLKLGNRQASTFGCYGWSGESVSQLAAGLKIAGFILSDEGLKVLWDPDNDAIKTCREFGQKFATNF